MLDESTKAKLRDPAYFQLHTLASSAIREVGPFGWYDSNFHRRFEVAKTYLAKVRPDAVQSFEEEFARLHAPSNFEVALIDEVFDSATRAKILDISTSVEDSDTRQSADEKKNFGRQVVWDHPFFLELQQRLLPTISGIVGCECVPGYNFLSLYGGDGKCDPHMDEPLSMYTFDYCIDQSEEWPIYFSKLVDWPTADTQKEWDKQALKSDPSLEFAPHLLKPNQALLFNGSSQWHYRDAIAPGGFCHLLFFHYFPAGCENLVIPGKWNEHFNIPELGPLCDLFKRGTTDGFA